MDSQNIEIKHKRVHLSVAEKLKLIEMLESGSSVASVCEIFRVKKQTVSDIRINKDKLKKFALKYGSSIGRKRMKEPGNINLDEEIYKWYIQQRASGIVVRSVDLKSTAEKLAQNMGLKFQGSNGWLWRFRKRHGIVSNKSCEADEEQSISNEESYNSNATAILYNDIPENAENYKYETTTSDTEENKEQIVFLEPKIEIEENILEKQEYDGDDIDEGAKSVTLCPNKLTVIKQQIDNIINYIESSSDLDVYPYYKHFKEFRSIITKKEQEGD